MCECVYECVLLLPLLLFTVVVVVAAVAAAVVVVVVVAAGVARAAFGARCARKGEDKLDYCYV